MSLLKYKLSDIKHRILQLENLSEHKNYLSAFIQRDFTEFLFPDWMKITRIGRYAFTSYLNLTSITIPDSVLSIDYTAFVVCKSLTDVYMLPITPPILERDDVFTNTKTTPTIHVPIGSGDAYKSATNWSSYADQIVEDIEI